MASHTGKQCHKSHQEESSQHKNSFQEIVGCCCGNYNDSSVNIRRSVSSLCQWPDSLFSSERILLWINKQDDTIWQVCLCPSFSSQLHAIKTLWNPAGSLLRNASAYFQRNIKSIMNQKKKNCWWNELRCEKYHWLPPGNPQWLFSVQGSCLFGMLPHRGHMFVDAHCYLFFFICTGKQYQYSLVHVV